MEREGEIHHRMNNSLWTSFETRALLWWLASETRLPNDSWPHYSVQFLTTSLQLIPVCQDVSAFKYPHLPGVLFCCFLDLTIVPSSVPSPFSLGGSQYFAVDFTALKGERRSREPFLMSVLNLFVFSSVYFPPLFRPLPQMESNHPAWNVSIAKAPCKLQKEMTNFMAWLW